MTKRLLYTVSVLFLLSCSTPKYFHDESSLIRQKEIQSSRAANITEDIINGIFEVSSAALLEMEPDWNPSERQFKKVKLVNPSTDTIYVNMLTDLEWDENDYCDFMDIRIPPKTDCKILVPTEAAYNLYYSNTPQSDDDELMEIFTSDVFKLILDPGRLAVKDSLTSK